MQPRQAVSRGAPRLWEFTPKNCFLEEDCCFTSLVLPIASHCFQRTSISLYILTIAILFVPLDIYVYIIYPKDYRWQQIHMLMWRELLDGHVNTKVVKVMQQILPFFLQSWGGPEDDVCCGWVCQTAIVFLRKNWNQRALLKIKDIWSIWPMCKYCSPWLESLVGRSLIDGGKALGNERKPTFISPMLSKWPCKYEQSIIRTHHHVQLRSRWLYCLTHDLSIVF